MLLFNTQYHKGTFTIYIFAPGVSPKIPLTNTCLTKGDGLQFAIVVIIIATITQLQLCPIGCSFRAYIIVCYTVP